MDDKNTNVTKSHKVLLANRKSGAFSGVVDVLSFDVAEILLETELGMLLIKGHDLHVNRLTLEKGEIDIEGRIDSLTYSDIKNTGKQAESILGRLFKCWLSAQLAVSRQPHLGYPYCMAVQCFFYMIFSGYFAESCHTGISGSVWRIFFTGSAVLL